MATDDERQEVARRLRETGDSTYPDLIGVIADHDGWYPASDAADRLADLIDPGEPKVRCVAEVKVDGERLEQLVHDAAVELTGIDRDALLALADEIEYGASSDDGEYHDLPAIMVAAVARKQMEYARRIREALGVKS